MTMGALRPGCGIGAAYGRKVKLVVAFWIGHRKISVHVAATMNTEALVISVRRNLVSDCIRIVTSDLL